MINELQVKFVQLTEERIRQHLPNIPEMKEVIDEHVALVNSRPDGIEDYIGVAVSNSQNMENTYGLYEDENGIYVLAAIQTVSRANIFYDFVYLFYNESYDNGVSTDPFWFKVYLDRPELNTKVINNLMIK